MVTKVIALLEGLPAADLEAARPTDLERFAALCHHWASLADLSRETPRAGILSDLNRAERSA